jgi:hypothetical protein
MTLVSKVLLCAVTVAVAVLGVGSAPAQAATKHRAVRRVHRMHRHHAHHRMHRLHRRHK